jgi:hypothetical protein
VFSAPYLDETLGFIVRDHLRDSFSSWEAIRALGSMRLGAPDLPYYVQAVRDRAPALQIEVVPFRDTVEQFASYEAFLIPAERGSVFTLLDPDFTVVVPQPDAIKVPLAYPISRQDDRWKAFMDTWIELKKRDGTIDKLYRHWILGQDTMESRPRWSVVRDVLKWVK